MLTRRTALGALAAGALGAADYPVRKAKVEPLWKAPDPNPNALEATPEGLWIGDQATDAAHLVDWKTGKRIRSVPTESYNTSGIAYGGGFLWMGANGAGPKVRPPRPTDGDDAEILKLDPQSGKIIARHPLPGASVHELEWAGNTLWVNDRGHDRVLQLDANFKLLHSIPTTLRRSHGLAWDRGSIWCLFSNDWLIQRLDAKDGRVIEAYQLEKGVDAEPHGLCLYQGHLYYADAGLTGSRPSNGKYSGYICRFAVGTG